MPGANCRVSGGERKHLSTKRFSGTSSRISVVTTFLLNFHLQKASQTRRLQTEMYRSHNPNAPGMHTDSHTRITYKEKPGIIQQLQGSFCASLLGILLVFVSFPVLYWNEGRAVQTALSLDEGLREVNSLRWNKIKPENHDKLVHLMGDLKTDKAVSDPEYGVAVMAAKLRREVEMLQWVEHTSTKEYDDGGSIRQETTYSYTTEWRSDIIRSKNFDNPNGHRNPSTMPVRSYTNEAKQVQVGEFTLSSGLVDKISEFHHIMPRDIPPGMTGVRIVDGMFYHSRDPFNPMVGDVRVSFSYAGYSGKSGSRLGDPMKVSIVARQYGDKLLHYHTQSGDSLELLYAGQMTAKEMFEAEHSANTFLTWVARGGGWFIMFIGFQLTASILTTLVSWLPLVRELVGLGVTVACVCLATSLTLLTVAIGWIAHRPLLGMALLLAAAVPIFFSRQWNSQKQEQRKH